MTWFGGALYERFVIVRNLQRTRGTTEELRYAQLILDAEILFKLSTPLVILTGIILTFLADYRFFDWSWLGVKQWITAIYLVFFIGYIIPRMNKFKAGFKPAVENGKPLDITTRAYLKRFYTGLDIMHIGLVVNIILALWKP